MILFCITPFTETSEASALHSPTKSRGTIRGQKSLLQVTPVRYFRNLYDSKAATTHQCRLYRWLIFLVPLFLSARRVLNISTTPESTAMPGPERAGAKSTHLVYTPKIDVTQLAAPRAAAVAAVTRLLEKTPTAADPEVPPWKNKRAPNGRIKHWTFSRRKGMARIQADDKCIV